MAKFMIGVDGVAHKVKNMFVGVDGVAHRVKTAYIGVDGQARVFFGGYYQPAVNEIVVNLLGSSQSFTANTIFAPGTYEIDIAGFPGNNSSGYTTTNHFKVQTTMPDVFKIVAGTSGGLLSYLTENSITLPATSIFGGSGGKSAGISISGSIPNRSYGCITTGSVCHFLPVNGVFGTNYLRCFHCGNAGSGTYGGTGAYGGGAGGRGARTYNSATRSYSNSTGATGSAGVGGSGGTGGTGTTSGSPGAGDAGKPGNSGSGIGAGTATSGGRAMYNGSSWSSPSQLTNTSGQAFITVKYISNL